MNYDNHTYIASCVFTKIYPELSEKIQTYVRDKLNMEVVRCCVKSYKVKEFEGQMPDCCRSKWSSLPQSKDFSPESTVVSLCHNCSAIIEETRPFVKRLSLWEVILQDKTFPYPNYNHEKMTIQDCWRSFDNRAEQDAIRELLNRMNIDVVELKDNYEDTDFCGITLFQLAPSRNLKLAPIRFVKNATGKFLPHTEERKKNLMIDYCLRFTTDKVVGYCHYCVEGLIAGNKEGIHIASLLFKE